MMQHLFLAAAEKSPWKGLFGAMHPGIVHFPIALLAVGALLETLQILRKRNEPAPGSTILAYIAAAAAVPASFFGFMLADYEGTEGSLLDLHKWFGIGSTVVALIAVAGAFKAKTSRGSLLTMRLGLIVGTVLVLSTGYLGGELVFGEGHILKHIRAILGISEPKHAEQPEGKTPEIVPPEPKTPVENKEPLLNPAKPIADKVDFAKDIAPVIKDMCFKCHGGEKVKGKFKLNTKKDAMDGGESGKAILPGKPTLSKFYTSLIDKDEDVLMPPPKEKVRPSKEQIEKVRLWIEQGADWPDGVEFKK
jgi:uncharacterized membrane protein